MPIHKKRVNLISLIIPSYRQGKTIIKDTAYVKKVMDSLRKPYEIIVVIDGHVDKSFEILQKKKLTRVHVVGYANNHGKGYAVRYGMANSKGNIVAFLDAGMDINPQALALAIDYMIHKKADIVVGSKLHPLSKVYYPWQRKVLSWGYRNFAKLLFGLTVSDTQVGLKVFRRRVLEDVLPRLLVKRYAFDIEILSVAYHLGYRKIYEVPIQLTFNHWSAITSQNFLQTVGKMLWDTMAVFYRLRILKYYDEGSRRKWRYDPELNFRVNIG